MRLLYFLAFFLTACSSSQAPPDGGPPPDGAMCEVSSTDACARIEGVWNAQGATLGCPLSAFVCPDHFGSNICCWESAVQECQDILAQGTTCMEVESAIANCACRFGGP